MGKASLAMPTTLDGTEVDAVQAILHRQQFEQAIVDAVAHSLSEDEEKEVQVWWTWIVAWRQREVSQES